MDAGALRHATLFRDLSRWEIRKVILLGQLRSAGAGERIVSKGEVGAELYMIVSGRARSSTCPRRAASAR